MKVEFKEMESKKVKKIYPWIGIWKAWDYIILFTAPEQGVVLKSRNENYKKGQYLVCKEDNFVAYEGQIILQNDEV